MELSSAIAEIITRVMSVFPRLGTVAETEGGVLWVRGKAKPLTSGSWFMYWPMWSEPDIIDTFRDTVVLDPQVMEGIAISCVVVYRVNDAPKAIMQLGNDVTNAVCDISTGAVSKVFAGVPCSRIRDDMEEFGMQLKDTIARELRRYGITVNTMYIREFTECKTHRIMGVDLGEE